MAIMIGALYRVTWRLEFTGISDETPLGLSHQTVGYEYNYAILAMAAALVILGAGVASIDHRLWRRRAAAPTYAEGLLPVNVR
jgi:uncharacterized membrane protein YphA (DoxX/SURF4 family)